MASYVLTRSIDSKNCPILKLPIEIIAKIARNLEAVDVLNLASTSRNWRNDYMNQNDIWKIICQRLNLHDEDYLNCITDNDEEYTEFILNNNFGNYCKWWKIYSRYNKIIKNIRENNFPTFNVSRQGVFESYCNDDYIINVYRNSKKNKIEALILKGYHLFKNKINIKVFDILNEMLSSDQNIYLNIAGNKRFLVFEVNSFIFVYTIHNGEFKIGYSKMIQSEPSYCPFSTTPIDSATNSSIKGRPSAPIFAMDICKTKIDICGDKLALVHPREHTVFQVDLVKRTISHELVYISNGSCISHVNTIKCAEDNRLMIGLTNQERNKIIYEAIIYHLDKSPEYNKLVVSMYTAVNKFKVAKNLIGIENNSPTSPFIMSVNDSLRVFWIDCDSFSFDSPRNCIYYNSNQYIFQYDITKSRSDIFDVIENASNIFPMSSINDRLLLVRSVNPDVHTIYDVIEHSILKAMHIKFGYGLHHVGRKTIVLSSSKEFVISTFF